MERLLQSQYLRESSISISSHLRATLARAYRTSSSILFSPVSSLLIARLCFPLSLFIDVIQHYEHRMDVS
jgi:hypothetical protein